jgi:HSP20 family protein
LPVAVRGDDSKASYHNGVLRIEMPKVQPGKPTSVNIKVD